MASQRSTEDIEIGLVLEAIHARYGYDLRGYAAPSIARRVRSLLARSGLPHLGELQHRLLDDPAFFASSLDELTVQVSDMFRDPDLYVAFRQRVVPILRTYPHVKIWHAGCASGEEVYATAILLAEENLYARCQIYATDLSAAALERAREGIYPEDRAAPFSRNYIDAGGKTRFEDHCCLGYGHIALHEGLRENVVFFQHNLASDYALGEMHVIFCRNVLIYFGSALQERVLSIFSDALCRGGFLCLGRSESLPASLDAQYQAFAARERVFRRRGQA